MTSLSSAAWPKTAGVSSAWLFFTLWKLLMSGGFFVFICLTLKLEASSGVKSFNMQCKYYY